MKYIASCSFGKDSLATILLALENNEPLDGAVFCEVMFDNKNGISGEIPEHIEWVYNTAIPKLEAMGVPVKVVRTQKDYLHCFYNIITRGERKGKISGFPLGGKCKINRECKTKAVTDYLKTLQDDIISYVGIASDEPIRLARLNSRKISLLDKYGYTEQMAFDLCSKHGLLSPIYTNGKRGGVGFVLTPQYPAYRVCERSTRIYGRN